jgi:GH35 family endo-1,4-beta-xylanase
MKIGTSLNYNHMRDDANYTEIAANQFNIVSAESGCNCRSIAKDWKEFDFTECDYVYLFSKRNSFTGDRMAYRGHALVSGINSSDT